MNALSRENKVAEGKIVSIVTDNASNMRAAWKLLEEKYPGLVCNGCAAHTVNLLVKDVCHLDEYKDTLALCRQLTAFVKDRNALTKRFEKIQKRLLDEREVNKARALVSVGETRW
jgi:hypothetical protein